MSKETADFDTTVCGIPCGVVVDTYHYQPPSKKCAQQCETPDEFYGYTEIEWHLLDRKGYHARWLEDKMTDGDNETLEEEIMEEYNERD